MFNYTNTQLSWTFLRVVVGYVQHRLRCRLNCNRNYCTGPYICLLQNMLRRRVNF